MRDAGHRLGDLRSARGLEHGRSGYLLPFENDAAAGRWPWIYRRRDPEYQGAYEQAVERLGDALYETLAEAYEQRGSTRSRARQRSSASASASTASGSARGSSSCTNAAADALTRPGVPAEPSASRRSGGLPRMGAERS